MRVRVFRNLTRRCLSIQARVPGKGWRTVAHAAAVDLADVRFKVSEAGRQRLIRTGRKTVHAVVEGELGAWAGTLRPAFADYAFTFAATRCDAMPATVCDALVFYNPRAVAHFTRRNTGEAIHTAPAARVASSGVRVPA